MRLEIIKQTIFNPNSKQNKMKNSIVMMVIAISLFSTSSIAIAQNNFSVKAEVPKVIERNNGHTYYLGKKGEHLLHTDVFQDSVVVLTESDSVIHFQIAFWLKDEPRISKRMKRNLGVGVQHWYEVTMVKERFWTCSFHPIYDDSELNRILSENYTFSLRISKEKVFGNMVWEVMQNVW